ncbi:ATP-binding protein [Sphingobium sp. SCG-1]|uniref:ATP-binding protein n=1 Tax=Sphingobium sp. SCG-1 TaxID=2072936 RepID=UPI003983026F
MNAARAYLPTADAAGHKNMVQLVQLRWLAVAGQLVTILFVHLVMHVRLPIVPMLAVIAALMILNIFSVSALNRRRGIANAELFFALLMDVAALTALLYLSGGATNPFVSLFLLQVVLGSVLLERWSSWLVVIATSLCFALLIVAHRPLQLPPQFGVSLFDLYIAGAWICFALIAVLLVLFVTRISENLRARDAHLADMRQQAAEQDHIMRMGLLASGAAHELGTPLGSLAVIIGDWRRMPQLSSDPGMAQDMAEMQAEVERCKAIVTRILLSAGEARGEAPAVTSVHQFFDELVEDWRATRGSDALVYHNRFGEDVQIVSDAALQQVIGTVLDNAAEVSPAWVGMYVERQDNTVLLSIRDAGPGFAPEMLANLGKPYQSTKQRPGGGLGLFLVVNVMRKLGGEVRARNLEGGVGAEVVLVLPLSAVALTVYGASHDR